MTHSCKNKSCICNAHGTTLVEVLIAITILGIIIGPFLSIFVFTSQRTKEAENVLKATFVAQQMMESLHTLDYLSALQVGNGEVAKKDNFLVETSCTPYYPKDVYFFQIIIKDNSELASKYDFYAIPPSGITTIVKSGIEHSIRLNMDFSQNNRRYALDLTAFQSDLQAQGILDEINKKIIIMINMVGYSGTPTIDIYIESGSRDIDIYVYDTKENRSNLTIFGVPEDRLRGFVYRDYSVLKAQVKVYKDDKDRTPLAKLDNILQLRN